MRVLFSAVLDMCPVPKGRPRFTRSGHAYTPAKTRAAELELALLVKSRFHREPSTQPLSVVVEFQLKPPKYGKKREFHTVRGDLDNYTKIIDGLNGVLWKDDSQIVSMTSRKFYGPVPKISITVFEMDPVDSIPPLESRDHSA